MLLKIFEVTESFKELSIFNTFEITGFEKLNISKNLEIVITKKKRITLFRYRYILNNFFPRVSNEIKLISSAVKSTSILNYSYKFHQNISTTYIPTYFENERPFENVSDFPNFSEKS